MFARSIIREYDFEKFVKKLRLYETNEGSYLTKNGNMIPQECIVCYMNINPSSILKAYKEFQTTMTNNMNDIVLQNINNQEFTSSMKAIKKIDVLLMNCLQKNSGMKYWVDVDFDISKKDINLLKYFASCLKSHNVNYYIIETKSGYHVLMEKSTLHYNYHVDIKGVNDIAKTVYDNNIKWEIVINTNAMVISV